MLRRCLTWLRATWVVRVLPLDQNILLHQMVGYAIVTFSTMHTTAHFMNFGTQEHTRSKPQTLTLAHNPMPVLTHTLYL